MLLETRFLISLFFTLAIEIPIVVLITRYLFGYKKVWRAAQAGLLASLLTLPYFWFVLPPYIPANSYILLGEIFVVLAEMVVYKMYLDLSLRNSFILSFAANLASFAVGSAIL